MKRLIALDYDGTTLRSDQTIAGETVRVIQRVLEMGHRIMVMTGRNFQSIIAELEKYGLELPVGTNNGAEVFVNRQLLRRISMSSDQWMKVMKLMEESGVPFKVTTGEGVFAPRDWDRRAGKMLREGLPLDDPVYLDLMKTPPEELGQPFFDRAEDFLSQNRGSIVKIVAYLSDPALKNRLQQQLKKIPGLNVTSSTVFNVEVLHKDANKGSGLQVMANHLGIPKEWTIAIGDQSNDIAMFRAAGFSIAMGNAAEDVKRAADFVTRTNDEDGVAYALKRFVLMELENI
jgi:HAD-superfamily hydrolase, subfamily IIB